MTDLGLRHRALVGQENIALLARKQAQQLSTCVRDSDAFTKRIKLTPEGGHLTSTSPKSPSPLRGIWANCLALVKATEPHIPGDIEQAIICALATSSKDDLGALVQWGEILLCCEEARLSPKFVFGIWQHGGRTVLQWLLEAKSLRSFQKVTDGLPTGKYPGGIAVKVIKEFDRRFAGQVKNGIFHGYGVFQWLPDFQMVAEEQAVYRGEFKEGWINGQGCKEYASSHTYEGSFVNGRRHGHGMCKWSKGRIFEGEFDDGSLVKGSWVCMPYLPSEREKVYN